MSLELLSLTLLVFGLLLVFWFDFFRLVSFASLLAFDFFR